MSRSETLDEGRIVLRDGREWNENPSEQAQHNDQSFDSSSDRMMIPFSELDDFEGLATNLPSDRKIPDV
jgi:hypothetical protein